jgi:rubrerythrin
MNTRTKWFALLAAGLLNGCIAPDPPPANGTAADPQVRGSSRAPRSLVARDDTTLAIEKQLSLTESTAASAQKMEHDMPNMPGMQHQTETHGASADAEKKRLADEMKKTSEEMKATSDAMKAQTKEKSDQTDYYTCVMHPQIHSPTPGNCPICGMKLVKKEADK